MFTRFQGEEGKRRLIEALAFQAIVRGDEGLARELAERGRLEEIAPGRELIAQGAGDNDLFLVLAGRVGVVVNGREMAVRSPGTHVGEMSVVDPAATRSASVLAIDPTIVLRVTEADLTRLALSRPDIWRRIALELCGRLRQRNSFVHSPNPRPVLFIGSSSEALNPVRAVQLGLAHDDFLVRLWTDGVFLASQYPMESLEQQLQDADFALLVVSPDDEVDSRGNEGRAPRDNVVFELGLFMGALGRQRTLIVRERNVDLKMPTDLLGITVLDYASGTAIDLDTRMAPVCEQIRRFIHAAGVR